MWCVWTAEPDTPSTLSSLWPTQIWLGRGWRRTNVKPMRSLWRELRALENDHEAERLRLAEEVVELRRLIVNDKTCRWCGGAGHPESVTAGDLRCYCTGAVAERGRRGEDSADGQG